MKKQKRIIVLVVCITCMAVGSMVFFEGKKASLTKLYQQYDDSYSPQDFRIDQVDALKGNEEFVMGCDISLASAIQEAGSLYYNLNHQPQSIYQILKENGINTVRLRLFYDYTSEIGTKCGKLDLQRVNEMIAEAKKEGLKVILDLHYSDSWADPAKQYAPYQWQDKDFDEVVLQMYQYTYDVLTSIKQNGYDIDYIQIGNEIDNGMVYPFGQIDWDDQEGSFDRLVLLLQQGCKATREVFPNCQIIIHTANGFYQYYHNGRYGLKQLFYYQHLEKRNLDYDIIGVSYYPTYGKKDMAFITDSINQYAEKIGKPVLLVETSYGYTYLQDQNVTNIFSLKDSFQRYPVSFQGQADYLTDIIAFVAAAKDQMGLGICYWGGEWIANQDSQMKSTWANQALFTYQGIATPVIQVFQKCRP